MSTNRRREASRTLDRPALEERALKYLDRFDATAARLAAVLRRAVDRAVPRSEGAKRDEAYAWCDQVVARCVELRLIDDSRYARSLASSMRQRGASARAIAHRLVARGIPRETAMATLQALAHDEQGNSELDAARALVRRRRLGHYRSEPERTERRKNDLATLARAGFNYETARHALELSKPDDGEP